MTTTLARGFASAVAISLFAQAAHADLTAQGVWSNWRDYMASAGYEVTGTENMAGNTLTVSDVAMTVPMPDAEGSVAFALPQLAFTEKGDGTVSIILPDTIPMRVSGKDDDGEDFTALINYGLSAGSMTASGSPEDTRYLFRATQVAIDLASAEVEGKPIPPETFRFGVLLDNVISNSTMQQGDLRSYSQTMEADKLSYDIAFDDPESDDEGTIKGELRGLKFDGNGNLPQQFNTDDMQQLLASGFAFEGVFDYLSGTNSVVGVGDGSTFNLQSSSKGGKIAMAMDAQRLKYDVSQQGTTLNIGSDALPVPVTLDMENAGFALDMPVGKSDDLQDFGLSINLTNFNMSEVIWAMFDEGATLPRGPASIVVDLAGKAKVLANYMDPKVIESFEENDQAPGELHALTIKNLLVSMFGAQLDGTGAFTFDNTDTTTFDGMPRPEGQANLTLRGGNALLDKLIALGLIGPDEAMGVRMMVGMVAVPGQGDDTLTSTIEINQQGQVLANGQRLR